MTTIITIITITTTAISTATTTTVTTKDTTVTTKDTTIPTTTNATTTQIPTPPLSLPAHHHYHHHHYKCYHHCYDHHYNHCHPTTTTATTSTTTPPLSLSKSISPPQSPPLPIPSPPPLLTPPPPHISPPPSMSPPKPLPPSPPHVIRHLQSYGYTIIGFSVYSRANGSYGSAIDLFVSVTSSAVDFFRHGSDSTIDFFGWYTYSSTAIDDFAMASLLLLCKIFAYSHGARNHERTTCVKGPSCAMPQCVKYTHEKPKFIDNGICRLAFKTTNEALYNVDSIPKAVDAFKEKLCREDEEFMYKESVDLCGRHTLQAAIEPVDKEMARGTELSEFDKGVFVGCHLSGLSSRTIAQKVNRPKSTVEFVVRRWKFDGHCANAARSRTLKLVIVKNRVQPMATIRQEFRAATGVSVSIGTLRTEAHQLGYFGRAAAHKPHIKTINKARRLRWCLDRRNWTLEQWKSVLWSDDSRFTLFRSDGRVWVWHLPEERLLLECIVPTRKFGGGGVMVWGCFTAFGVGPLVFVRGSMNTEAYCNILDSEMFPTLWIFYGMDPFYFQDYNSRCHVSRATMQWYEDNNVRRLDWSTQSPDLNTIEHLWDELDRLVRARQARPKTIAQLMEWLQEGWRRIPVDVLQTLVDNMPDRKRSSLNRYLWNVVLSPVDGTLGRCRCVSHVHFQSGAAKIADVANTLSLISHCVLGLLPRRRVVIASRTLTLGLPLGGWESPGRILQVWLARRNLAQGTGIAVLWKIIYCDEGGYEVKIEVTLFQYYGGVTSTKMVVAYQNDGRLPRCWWPTKMIVGCTHQDGGMFMVQSMSCQSQCSRVLQAPSRTIDLTHRFHTLSSIHATNTSLAVVLAISSPPRFTSLAHTRPGGLRQKLPAAGLRHILGRHLETSPTRVMRRGGLRRQPVSPEHSCVVVKRIVNSSRREEVCDVSKSCHCRYHGIPRRGQPAMSASFQKEGRARWVSDYGARPPSRGQIVWIKGKGKREIPEKTRRKSGVNRPGIEPVSWIHNVRKTELQDFLWESEVVLEEVEYVSAMRARAVIYLQRYQMLTGKGRWSIHD
ncbi:hypothetical protein PR048_013409 [Dryococelus australis]|uniref:Transposase Tc1-like domain-containing protein n=1 Tax=Dryococelus australis TaxID=614101 RepID=A0ABQ9HS30_9NEOP|nr:hypothetical protein PR048_013409 [Dryococelus australis]